MSDLTEEVENDENVVVEADPSTEEQTEELEDSGDNTEEGRKWVDFTPEQQKKFNDMYKQTKMSDSRNQMLTKMLEEQQKQLDELKSRFSQTDEAEAEKILKERIQEARDAGDLDTEVKLFKELANFEKAASKAKPVSNIVDDPDTKYLVALGQELDDTGEPIRPWLANTHPQHRSMLTKAQIIVAELEADGIEPTVPQVMKILDQRMNKKPTATRAPSPMERGNLTSGRNGPNIKPKLSQTEKDIARKLGLSEADYLDGKVTYGVKR